MISTVGAARIECSRNAVAVSFETQSLNAVKRRAKAFAALFDAVPYLFVRGTIDTEGADIAFLTTWYPVVAVRRKYAVVEMGYEGSFTFRPEVQTGRMRWELRSEGIVPLVI